MKYEGIEGQAGASKALERRGELLNNKLFKGKGIDIGAGLDGINKYGFNAYSWDLKDGDAQALATVPDNHFDFVHSSHCLEHMVSVRHALRNWIRVCKPGGFITIVIPDEELYERNHWPSKFNTDHKWSFRILNSKNVHKKHINITDLVTWVEKEVEIIKIERIEEGFDFTKSRNIDQTGPADGPECSIEIILRKL
jgi:predicted SAM-dependent methyltransferase